MVDPMRVEEVAVEVDGGTLAAFRFGDAPVSAPIVLAVHGITANSRAWLPVARALEARAVLVAPDLRGRASSSGMAGPYGIAAHVADVLAVADQLGLRRGTFVGHSLGAYILARLAVDHPERVDRLVLVDGGLPIPRNEAVDPQEFADAFLGPAIARLKLRFPTREAYHQWWREHPAIAAGDIADGDLISYADHDLLGAPPELRSSVREESVRADVEELADLGDAAYQLAVPTTLLCAPRGLLDDPQPMQPLELARAWIAEVPSDRAAALVEDVNHYTIILGSRGAAAVADAIGTALVP
jgi:pimeloyl-ACP methyl ester carboxylesterase